MRSRAWGTAVCSGATKVLFVSSTPQAGFLRAACGPLPAGRLTRRPAFFMYFFSAHDGFSKVTPGPACRNNTESRADEELTAVMLCGQVDYQSGAGIAALAVPICRGVPVCSTQELR